MFDILRNISEIFISIYDIIYSSLGYSATALVLSIFVGFMAFVAMYSIIKIWCPAPDRQIQHTWNFVSNANFVKNGFLKKNNALDSEQEKESRSLDKQKWIEESYTRLGRTLKYDDYLKSVGTTRIVGMGLGIVLILVGLLMNISILNFLGIFILAAGALFAENFVYKGIKGNIKKLNLDQKLELPILITRFMSIARSYQKYPLRDVLSTYLPYAGALYHDIQLTLADIKSFGDIQALGLWQARACHNATTEMMELTQFVEKLKKLYSSGDEIYVKTELSYLQRQIDEKYVLTLIDKRTKKSVMKLIICMILSFVVLGTFVMLPKMLEIIEAMGGAMSAM